MNQPNRMESTVSNLPSVLVVDDEHDLLELIEYNLQQEGFRVFRADNGEDGLALCRQYQPDVMLLDIMMPGLDGFDVYDTLRNTPGVERTPVIFLTAREDEKSEVKSLNLGADDYLTKPISTAKLVSRIRAVLRKIDEYADYRMKDRFTIHDLEIDRDRYVVRQAGQALQLPRKEFELLSFLASNKGKVFGRQELLNRIWGDDIYVIDRTVDVHIRKIREKLQDDYIETIKGVGYRFKE